MRLFWAQSPRRLTAIALNLILAVGTASLLSSCSEPAPAPGDTESPTSETPSGDGSLKLGALLPATGDLSSIGQNMPLAVQLAVDTIN